MIQCDWATLLIFTKFFIRRNWELVNFPQDSITHNSLEVQAFFDVTSCNEIHCTWSPVLYGKLILPVPNIIVNNWWWLSLDYDVQNYQLYVYILRMNIGKSLSRSISLQASVDGLKFNVVHVLQEPWKMLYYLCHIHSLK